MLKQTTVASPDLIRDRRPEPIVDRLPHRMPDRMPVGAADRTIWRMLKNAFAAWNTHEASRMGAALAFYTLLSVAPLVILIIAILALIFGDSAAQQQFLA